MDSPIVHNTIVSEFVNNVNRAVKPIRYAMKGIDPTVCLVTTLRDPGSSLTSFLRYHLSIGISHIFLFWEGGPDTQRRELDTISKVTVTDYDTVLLQAYSKESLFYAMENYVEREIMARQMLNVALAIRWARNAGFDWLLHLDSDELLWLSDGRSVGKYFGVLGRLGIGQCVFLNHEAVPETEEIEDCFREVTLFKVNRQTILPSPIKELFIAYRNGKAAARIHDELTPHGLHRFVSPISGQTIVSSNAYVLHYPSCGLSNHIRKYRFLGDFKDPYRNNGLPPPFHIQSRDLILSGRLDDAKKLYHHAVMLDDVTNRQQLCERGLLTRIVQPSISITQTSQ